ncbi:P1 family peptidase [Streptomyces sp. NPDC048172]|uniref:P1 family peptidase n=1 Tax=Streptomyces sp. NPDC048172 TaxID=3365505 RepID=UPI00371A5CEA
MTSPTPHQDQTNPRARELGLAVGTLPPGPLNAVTDVPGVRVGHTTVRRPPDVHSGVTAVVPGEVSPYAPLPAGVFRGNGYGKLIGSTQIEELGQIETPVLLTSTLSAFRAADALVGWMLERPECRRTLSLNPVVGECNDGRLSDIRSRPVGEAEVRAALDGARGGPVAEGCVGGGTGLGALGFKAGMGTASRRFALEGRTVTVGALVQANFGGVLRVRGTPVTPADVGVRDGDGSGDGSGDAEIGSCVVVIATDAPLDARQLGRVARRAVFALARTGAGYGHGSGDYGLALATRRATGSPAADSSLDPLFEAVLDSTEEAVLNSLLAATTTTGVHGRTLHALPAGPLLARLGS